MDKITIGQQLFLVEERNSKSVRYCTVQKIGRKYFYVSNCESKIPLDATFPFKCPFPSQLTIYLSEDQWEKEKERNRNISKITSFVERRNLYSLSPEKIEKILAILESEE